MKKILLAFSLLTFAIAQSQTNPLGDYTPATSFDTLYDMYGGKHALKNLKIDTTNRDGYKAASLLCSSAGYFNVYFETGCGMDGSGSPDVDRRNVICKLLTDISAFIQPANSTVRVNLWVRNVNNVISGASTSGLLGLATSFYDAPNGVTSSGIADNEIWKTINSGTDSYTNMVSPLTNLSTTYSSSGVYFHGFMTFNFANTGYNWNTDMGNPNPSGYYDLYSIALHEMTHALGFASLIDWNGSSKFGSTTNYYSRYDLFLKTHGAAQNLITNSGSCSMYYYAFNPAISAGAVNTLSPLGLSGCGGTLPSAGHADNTTCSTALVYSGATYTVPLYTPNCFEEASSLSHFEDQCVSPYVNNAYFTMSDANGTGSTFMKRYLKPEERSVLCDLGYSVNTYYGNTLYTANNYSYTGSACPGLQVAGINDGINISGYYTFTGAVSSPISITGVLTNDFPSSGLTFECMEVVIGNGTLSNTTGTACTYTPVVGGVHLLRYIPKTSGGNRGNITYVYVYATSTNCTPSACDIVNNGGYESVTNCGQMTLDIPPPSVDCWALLSASPDVYARGCSNSNNPAITIPTSRCSPTSDTWDYPSVSNNKAIGLWSKSGVWAEGLQNSLSASLASGSSYVLSFVAKVENNFSNNLPVTLIFGGSTGLLAPITNMTSTPPSLTVLASVAVPNNNAWNNYSLTVTNTSGSSLSCLSIINAMYLYTAGYESSVLIDDISLVPTSGAPSFTPPANVCVGGNVPDLSVYAVPSGGAFAGSGISLSGGIYSFTATAGNLGNNLIAYTYTNTSGCVKTAPASINVTYSISPITVSPSSVTICSGLSTTLIASGTSSYTWSTGPNTNSISVSPSSTTVYSVTGTSIGCAGSSSGSATVTVISSPTITVSASPSFSICSGATTTLTASGASTYTWNTTATTAAISVNPSVSTGYTVTGTGSNGCTSIKTATLTVISPTISINPSNPTICSGTSTTFTASGATTYTWSANAGSATTSTVTVSPSTTTTYTVTGTNGSCTSTKTVTATVNATPTVSISPSSANICYGTSQTFTASGATTYTWSANAGSASTSTVTVSPITNTTYTVTGTSGSCTATKTVSVTIQSNTCSGSNPSYTISANGAYLNATGFIAQNMYIGNGSNTPSYTINCANMGIAPNVSITVANNATLTVTGSWLHACASCSGSMWQGIVVQNGGKLIVTGYSIIEDAVQAVYTQSNLSTTPIPNWQINQTIFNKNGTDIYVDAHPGNLSGNTSYNSIFTCRTLTSHSVTSTNFAAIKTSIAAATPLSPGTNTLTVTLAGARTGYGMYLSAATYTAGINIGNTTSGNNNIFDNMDYGVFSVSTPITVKNNNFINLTGNDCSCFGSPNPLGIGVSVYGSGFEGVPPQVIIGNANATVNNAEKNYFTGCLRGVLVSSCMNVYINNNTFNNETTATTFTTSGTFVTGEYAVTNTGFAVESGTATPTENFLFCNNSVNNCATGLFFDFGKLYNTGGPATITSNTISAVGTSTNYCNTGMFLQQSNTFGTVSGMPLTGINIAANSITNVNTNCVYAQNVNNSTGPGFLNIAQNTELSIKPNTYTVVQSPRIAAVSVSNCWWSRISDNANIRCTGVTGTTIPTGQYQAGVYVNQSPRTSVNCNTVSNIGECFVWESTAPTYTANNSSWQRNNLDYSRYGLVLRSTGVMGNQGNSTYPINNTWGTGTSTHFAGAQTLSDGSAPATSPTSKLYESASSCTLTPCTNTVSIVTGSVAYATSTSLLSASGLNTLICASDGSGGGGGGSGRMAQTDTTGTNDSMKIVLLDMLINNGTLSAYDYETRWALHHQIHSIMPGINVNTGIYANAKSFAQVDIKLGASDYIGAKNLLNAISPTNVIEQNHMTVDKILIKLHSDTLNTNDVSALKSVASQCHLTGGSIVWRARALVNSYYKNIIYFADVCPTANGARLAGIANGNSDNKQLVTVYPNPNNGSMIIEYSISNDAVLDITDINGKLVGRYNLSAAGTTLNITNDKLENGIYIYHVTGGNNYSNTGKIVIMK